MFKRLVKAALRRFGYRLSRIRPDDFPSNPRIDHEDVWSSLRVIERVTKNGSSSMSWERSRRYLDDRRVNFYFGVLEVLEQRRLLEEGMRVLDIGIYFGYLLRILHRYHPTASYHGTETHETRLAIAKELCPFAAIWRGTIADLSNSEPYDLVLLTEVLEHLVNPAESLHKLIDITDVLLLTVPDGRRDVTQAMQYHPEWGSYRGHVNFWSPESWQSWLGGELPNHKIDTGRLPTDKLFAVVQKNAKRKGDLSLPK